MTKLVMPEVVVKSDQILAVEVEEVHPCLMSAEHPYLGGEKSRRHLPWVWEVAEDVFGVEAILHRRQ